MFIKNEKLLYIFISCDLRHNMDVRRLKGVSAKDLARVEKYQKMYLQIKNELNK